MEYDIVEKNDRPKAQLGLSPTLFCAWACSEVDHEAIARPNIGLCHDKYCERGVACGPPAAHGDGAVRAVRRQPGFGAHGPAASGQRRVPGPRQGPGHLCDHAAAGGGFHGIHRQLRRGDAPPGPGYPDRGAGVPGHAGGRKDPQLPGPAGGVQRHQAHPAPVHQKQL